MIDHVILTVSDLDRSKTFYERALAPLRMTATREFPWGPTQSRVLASEVRIRSFLSSKVCQSSRRSTQSGLYSRKRARSQRLLLRTR